MERGGCASLCKSCSFRAHAVECQAASGKLSVVTRSDTFSPTPSPRDGFEMMAQPGVEVSLRAGWSRIAQAVLQVSAWRDRPPRHLLTLVSESNGFSIGTSRAFWNAIAPLCVGSAENICQRYRFARHDPCDG